MSEFVAESFTNEFGQVINPGDEVVYAGVSYKSTRFNRGTFDGVYKEQRRNYDYKTRSYGDVEEIITAVRVGGVEDRRWFYDEETKKSGWKPVVRKAILPLKRVFKLDTNITEMIGKSF